MAKQFGNSGQEGRILDKVSNGGTNTPIVSDPFFLEDLTGISFQLVTTGTIAGAWKIDVSNDYSVGLLNDRANPSTATWTDVTAKFVDAAGNPDIAAVLSGGSNQATQADPFMFRAYRVTFTPTSGTGTVYCVVFAKARA